MEEFLSAFQEFQLLFRCPICQNLLQDVHVVSECGHVFCGDCIRPRLGVDCQCPRCHLPARVGNLKRLPSQNSLIQTLRDLNRLLETPSSFEEIVEAPTEAEICESDALILNESFEEKDELEESDLKETNLENIKSDLNNKSLKETVELKESDFSASLMEPMNSDLKENTLPTKSAPKENQLENAKLKEPDLKHDETHSKTVDNSHVKESIEEPSQSDKMHQLKESKTCETLSASNSTHSSKRRRMTSDRHAKEPKKEIKMKNQTSDHWTCELCTFNNTLSARKCKICGNVSVKSRKSTCSVKANPLMKAPHRLYMITLTGLNVRERESFMVAVGKLNRSTHLGIHVTVIDDVSLLSQATHVLTKRDKDGLCSRTFKYMLSILMGKRILAIDWILEMSRKACWLPEEEFEIQGDVIVGVTKAPQTAHHSPSHGTLFEGYQFYLQGQFQSLTKLQVTELIQRGGGTILSTKPARSTTTAKKQLPIIITDKQSRTSMTVMWIMNCISHYKIIQDVE